MAPGSLSSGHQIQRSATAASRAGGSVRNLVSYVVAAVLAGLAFVIPSIARADARETRVIVEFRGPAAEVSLRVRDFERDVQRIEARSRSSQTDSNGLATDAVSVRVD